MPGERGGKARVFASYRIFCFLAGCARIVRDMTRSVTTDEFAAMRGVSPALIEWLATEPGARPSCDGGYVRVSQVFCAMTQFAGLWGAGHNTVRFQIRRYRIRVYGERHQVEVHQG